MMNACHILLACPWKFQVHAKHDGRVNTYEFYWNSEDCFKPEFIPDFSNFDPAHQIWKAEVPPEVHLLVWLVARGKVNTCNNIQKRRTLHYLNHH